MRVLQGRCGPRNGRERRQRRHWYRRRYRSRAFTRCGQLRRWHVCVHGARCGEISNARAARAPGEEAACVQQARRNQPVRFGRYEFVSERPDVRAQRGSRRAHRCRGFDRSEDEPGHLSRRRFSQGFWQLAASSRRIALRRPELADYDCPRGARNIAGGCARGSRLWRAPNSEMATPRRGRGRRATSAERSGDGRRISPCRQVRDGIAPRQRRR